MAWCGEDYDARFERLENQGVYLHGEADFVDTLVGGPPAAVLDAGCGTGRVAVELARRGYEVTGVDVEPQMLRVATTKSETVAWGLVDLASGHLPDGAFDVAVAAGNVMIFVELGTEAAVVANLARCLRPGGRLVAGFQLGRQLPLERYDELCAASGLHLDARYGTWEGTVFDGGDYAVSVHRRR